MFLVQTCMLQLSREEMYPDHFNVIRDFRGRGFDALLSKVHPLKQREVMSLVRVAQKHKVVSKVYLFGSALLHRCHPGSDIDIGVLYHASADAQSISQARKEFVLSVGDIDIFAINDMKDDSTLRSEILKGLVIYVMAFEQDELITIAGKEPTTRLEACKKYENYYIGFVFTETDVTKHDDAKGYVTYITRSRDARNLIPARTEDGEFISVISGYAVGGTEVGGWQCTT